MQFGGAADQTAGEPEPRRYLPFAMAPSLSRGRAIAEPACPMRSVYQRDRDRVVHATAFRRLTYKTQVFLFHEGDHYRTRLTHTLEVAQIARSIARLLQLNEDLAEALALAHDLGHPPFGHAGERALNAAMAAHGGFDHNAQSLKVVTRLERKYSGFDGLNLTFETLEGLVKHNGPVCAGTGQDVLLEAIGEAELGSHLFLGEQAPAEAQAAALADDIAYSNHDIDDGLRAGLLRLDDLKQVPLVGAFVTEALANPRLDRQRIIYEVNRRMITAMIDDCVSEARRRIGSLVPKSVADVRHAPYPIVAFSDAREKDLQALKTFLFANVYRHVRVMSVMAGAETIVADLFARYLSRPDDLPSGWSESVMPEGGRDRALTIGDFVAGMTDRYAIAEHRRLFDATPGLR